MPGALRLPPGQAGEQDADGATVLGNVHQSSSRPLITS